MRTIILRSANANNVKSYLSFNEMNKKDLPVMHSNVFLGACGKTKHSQ